MKKILWYITCIVLAMLLMTGCGTITTDPGTNADNGSETENDAGADNDVDNNTEDDADADNDVDSDADNDAETDNNTGTDNEEDEYQFTAEIIEAGDYLLVTPAEGSSELRSSDRISVGTTNALITGVEGNSISLADLRPGDLISITYNGMIAESYPAQITASAIEVTGRNQLLDGYLAMIDDIWQQDTGLNSEIEMIALDTTDWIGISDIDKEILFALLKEAYGFDVIEGTYEELTEQGLIDAENLYFTNGVHIIISDMKVNEKITKITYKIKKWRGGLGAIGSDDATAKYDDGEWTITMDGMWIS